MILNTGFQVAVRQAELRREAANRRLAVTAGPSDNFANRILAAFSYRFSALRPAF